MNIHDRIQTLLHAIGAVGKGGENKHLGFLFRSIDQCLNALAPALREAGLTPSVHHDLVSYESDSVRSVAVVKTTFRLMCAEGEWQSVAIGEGADKQDKALNKAMSAGFKYAVFQGLVIPVEDAMEADSDAAEPIARAPRPAPRPAPRAAPRNDGYDELESPPPAAPPRRHGARVVTYDFDNGKPLRKPVAELSAHERAGAVRIASNGVAKQNQYSERAQQDLDALNGYESEPPF